MDIEEIVLPRAPVKASFKSPRKLMLYSKPKVGKTSALAQLPDSLILDFERGTDFLDAVKVSINDLAELRAIGSQIIKEGKPYKYIIVDTVTKMEEMVIPLAGQMYQQTPMGKNWKGDNVLTLDKGAGYQYHRMAFSKIADYIETLAERVIYVGHLKTKFLEKNGLEVSSAEIDLIGKVKSMLSADVDGIGLLYRDGDKTMVSFKTTDDIICGTRADHLRNKELVLSEMIDGKLVTHWDQIYID